MDIFYNLLPLQERCAITINILAGMNKAGTNDVVKNFVYPAADAHDDVNDPDSVTSAEDTQSYSSTGQRNILFYFVIFFI